MKSKGKSGDCGGFGKTVTPTKFKDRNAGKDKDAEKFIPTDSEPVKLHHKLAGR